MLLWAIRRSRRALRGRPKRRLRPIPDDIQLEGRTLLSHLAAFRPTAPAFPTPGIRAAADDRTPPVVTLSARPNILWPPNHRFVGVVVTGRAFDPDMGSGLAGPLRYRVLDEYHRVQPSGPVNVTGAGRFSFLVDLAASRSGQDRDGRQYWIQVTAEDNAGNTTTATTPVTVPHDMGHRLGSPSVGRRLPFRLRSHLPLTPFFPASGGGPVHGNHGNGPGHGLGRGHSAGFRHALGHGQGHGHGHGH